VTELSDGSQVDDYFEGSTADNIELTVGKRLLDEQLNVFLTVDHTFKNDRTESEDGPTAPSDAYTLFDLGVGYSPNSGALEDTEFRISFENITDEDYRQFGSTRTGQGQNIVLSVAQTF
jgi:outer membrane receptor protein involved in Fe transport